jgi:hypothetical protein
LLALQADILARTEAFDKRYPDRSRLDEEGLAELQALEKEQRELAELVQGIADAQLPGEQQ